MRDICAWAVLTSAVIALSGCHAPGSQARIVPGQNGVPAIQPIEYQHASQLVDRFDADMQRGGITEAMTDIDACYRFNSQSPNRRTALRECFQLDEYGHRVNQEVAKTIPAVGNNPFYQQSAIAARFGRYGPVAGFSDPEDLGYYVGRGVGTMLTVKAVRVQQEQRRG